MRVDCGELFYQGEDFVHLPTLTGKLGSTFISQDPDGPEQSNALGRPQHGRRIAILGPDGPVPRNTEGTIPVRRDDPGLMLGYLDAPEATAAKFQGDWFMTGDQGAMDAHDQIIYLGRADDMMNAGGFRVSPIEVEQVLLEMRIKL